MMLRKIAALAALVLLSGGCAGAENSPAEAVMPDPGRPTVFSIDERGFWRRDGGEFFPLVAALPWDMADAAEGGFNFGVTGADQDGSPGNVAANLAILDEAARNGMYIMLHVCNLFRGKEDYESLKIFITALKDHPALASWYLADEPELTDTSAETLRRARDIIHELDPAHPVSGCVLRPENYGEYRDCFDVFMPDPYPIPDRALSMVADWLEAARGTVAREVSMIPYIQGFGQPFVERGPDEREIRNITLQMIAAAPQGIAWWAYGTMHDSAERPVYREMAAQCGELAPVLYGAEAEQVREGGLLFSRITSPRGTIVVAVNTGAETVSALCPWELPGEEFPMGTGAEAEGRNLHFAPQGSIVFLNRNENFER